MRIVLLFLLVHLISSPSAAQKPDSAEAEILQRFTRFAEAFQAADAEVLKDMLTGDYVHTGPTGSVSTKGQWLEWIQSRRAEIEAGTFRFDNYEMVDVSVRVYGDATVITGLNRASGFRDGQPFTHRIRFTNVWVRQDGEWRRAAFHDSHELN